MKPEASRGKAVWASRMCAALLACLAVWVGPALAQSAYACRGLEQHSALPSVEGAEGTFFAIRPELQTHHSLADDTIARLAALGDALAARGTSLVLLPVPTRAQVLTSALPVSAGHVGYSLDLSLAVHEDMIERLTAAGIAVADARPALRASALAGEPPFFKTDPRPNVAGLQIMAASVAEVTDQIAAPRGTFETTATDEVTLASQMRAALQRACQSELPPVRSAVHSTEPDAPTASRTGDAAPGTLVVVGTEITGTEALNLPGFLSIATGFFAKGYGVPEGGAFAAISTYLTSSDFTEAPPTVLVWEWPVVASMTERGPQPLSELIAAARGGCVEALDIVSGSRLSADLSGLPEGRDVTLAFDADSGGIAQARFHITGRDGFVRTRSIYRHPEQGLSGRFYLPLGDLIGEGLQLVEIETDGAVGESPTLAGCVE